jgi:hypothetical protein
MQLDWVIVMIMALAGVTLIAWWWRDVSTTRAVEFHPSLRSPDRPGLAPETVSRNEPRDR